MGLTIPPAAICIAVETRSKASDGKGAGSAPSTSTQETTDGDQARNKDTEYRILLPFVRRICENCLQHKKGNFMALSLNDEVPARVGASYKAAHGFCLHELW